MFARDVPRRNRSDEPRTRERIATRAVTALVPLAATSAAIAALLIGDAGWRYRVAADDGGSAPTRWSFAASPVTGTAVIACLVVVAVLLIGALIVFHSPPKPRGRTVEQG
ncbi:hypothetical protein MTP03_42580 [Tsukamurella sp. PLM1]|nr:hypothetical protein MTP03_42580 [Tsukamurella sp. PLM1]